MNADGGCPKKKRQKKRVNRAVQHRNAADSTAYALGKPIEGWLQGWETLARQFYLINSRPSQWGGWLREDSAPFGASVQVRATLVDAVSMTARGMLQSSNFMGIPHENWGYCAETRKLILPTSISFFVCHIEGAIPQGISDDCRD